MTALEKWKNDFKEFISELSIPRDDYKGIMEYIDEVPNEASEQQPCEDAISRQAVLDGLASIAKVKARSDAQKSLMGRIMFFVEQLPPVTPKEKTGRWLHREDMDYLDENKVMHNHFMCKDCGFIHDFVDGHTAQYKYCPNCGKRIQEMEE